MEKAQLSPDERTALERLSDGLIVAANDMAGVREATLGRLNAAGLIEKIVLFGHDSQAGYRITALGRTILASLGLMVVFVSANIAEWLQQFTPELLIVL